jgi:hypothetical protein
MMKILEPAYVAGLLDGEGCLCIYKRGDKNSVGRNFRGEISMGMTKRRAIDGLKETYGGHISNHLAQKTTWSDQFHWKLADPGKMLRLIEEVKPFMLIKHEQLIILEKLCNFRVNRRRNERLNESDIEFYIGLYDEMKKLNARGK